MAITPQDYNFNQLLARSLPSGDPLIAQLQAGSLSANTSPVPRIVPPTAGIFARRSADPGPYPVAQPYTLPKPNLFGVEPPGVGEQDLPPQPPAVNYGDMTFSQLLGEDLSPAQKFTKEITKPFPDVIKNPTVPSISAAAGKLAASAVYPPAAILSAAGSVAGIIHERNKQAEIQRRLKTPDPSSMMPQLGIHRPDFDPITWNTRPQVDAPPLPPQLNNYTVELGLDGFIEVDTTDVDHGEFQGDVGGGFEEGGIEEGGFEASRDFYDF
jgi:hypothetical protein